MRLKEVYGCHLRGFARTSYEITKQWTITMLCRKCWIPAKLWDAIWLWKSTLWGHYWIFAIKSRRSQWRTRWKIFTNALRLRKNSTKAIGLRVYWQTIGGPWKRVYVTPNTGEIHLPLNFRGKFQPVSWECKVRFCTSNSSVSLKSCLIETFCSLHKTYC